VAVVNGVLMLVGGILLLPVADAAFRLPKVTAVPVELTTVSGLTPSECEAGRGLRVEFDWHGATRDEVYYPQCSRIYRTGETFRAYAASTDPSDLSTNPEAITDPSIENPFAVIGPNDFGPVIAYCALCAFVGGIGLILVGLLSRPKRRRAPN
jgi:hypothetical protein